MISIATIGSSSVARAIALSWTIIVLTALDATAQPLSSPAIDNLARTFSNGEPRTTVGLYGTGGMAIHAASFRGMPEAPSCCLDYGSTTGGLFEVGAMIRHHTIGGWAIATQVGFESMRGVFAAQESTTIIVAGKATEARIGHDLSVGMQYLQVVPSIQYSVLGPVYASLGLGFHVNMGGSIVQTETLLTPTSTGTFQTTGQRVRNGYDGSMYSANDILVSFRLGAGAAFWLDDERRFAIEPMLQYDYYFGTPINRVDDWTLHALRLGVALRHTMDWHIGR